LGSGEEKEKKGEKKGGKKKYMGEKDCFGRTQPHKKKKLNSPGRIQRGYFSLELHCGIPSWGAAIPLPG